MGEGLGFGCATLQHSERVGPLGALTCGSRGSLGLPCATARAPPRPRGAATQSLCPLLADSAVGTVLRRMPSTVHRAALRIIVDYLCCGISY